DLLDARAHLREPLRATDGQGGVEPDAFVRRVARRGDVVELRVPGVLARDEVAQRERQGHVAVPQELRFPGGAPLGPQAPTRRNAERQEDGGVGQQDARRDRTPTGREARAHGSSRPWRSNDVNSTTRGASAASLCADARRRRAPEAQPVTTQSTPAARNASSRNTPM